ncbi:sigma-70 family RNA polymerase sigma factor [uncultured Paraglaciecola sp.]|uniref:RNA polymerase sigma factor n=1 Tax=uncultured Paraglaciecola sp. TaxID=1765024 RepID=UPI002615CD7A|nr:sigma-70 family RNA polymerase sigma factor [uncultured Paraglaciecola sp.]
MQEDGFLSIENALKKFIAQTKAQQLAVLVKMVGLAEAEEILQEAYLKIYLLVNKNPDKSHPLAQFMALQPLLYSMVKNLAITSLRHHKVVKLHCQKSGDLMAENGSAMTQSSEFELMKKDQEALLLSAINHLPPVCRQVFVQRKIHAKSHSEIAAILGISTKTVESHLAKGLILCRNFVNKANQNDAKILSGKAV